MLGFMKFFCCLEKKRRNVTKDNKVVFLEGCFFKFDFKDLLRSNAVELGTGSFGPSYKATLDESVTVVLKRLKDVVVGKKEFEQQMEIIGRADPHPNVAPLRAYYYSEREKLLLYNFFSTGSMLTLLHGKRDARRTPVNWKTRVKIALGTARGIAHIHAFGGPNFVHGNITSSNVLINQDGDGCISETGLTPLVKFPPSTSQYQAPEVLESQKHSHKSDVYSYCVLLLEMLTGKQPQPQQLQSPGSEGIVDLPNWVQLLVRKGRTVEVFDVELMKFQNSQEEVPTMDEVVKMIEGVCVKRPTMVEVVKMIKESLFTREDNGR